MGKKKKKKGQKSIDIEELLRKRREEDIEDADFEDIEPKRKSRFNVGSKSRIRMKIRDFERLTDELRYRTAASKFKKERIDESEPADEDDVEKLRKAAIEAVRAFAEKANLEQRYADDVIKMLKKSDPEETVDIASRIHDEIGKSEKLETWRNYMKRGLSGQGWYMDEKDDYEVDPLYGLPMDEEASKEIGRILKKYRDPFDDGWNGYWEPMHPNIYEDERIAAESARKQARAQASYANFIRGFMTGSF